MGGVNSTPSFEVIDSISQQTCVRPSETGCISFTHIHSLMPGSTFFQNLNIRSRVLPRETMKEEYLPGDYKFGFNSEIEGIQFGSKFDANSVEVTATIPFNDDFTFSLSSSFLPVFSLSASAECHTNVINSQFRITNIDFLSLLIQSSVVFQISDSLLAGSSIQFHTGIQELRGNFTTSYQSILTVTFLQYKFI